ncbi:MAG: DUF924 family protein [Acetobacteraceae bacterium]
MIADAEAVLAFWFEGEPDRFQKRWFKADPAFDAACRQRFATTWEAARGVPIAPGPGTQSAARNGSPPMGTRGGAFREWAEAPRGALALTLVLDQFPRNMHRGTRLAFASDGAARAVAELALARGFDAALWPVQRIFLYLPFEHSERLEDQEKSVALFKGLSAAPGLADADGPIDYARRHRDVIRRFGRFPHRNAALGRVSTPEELAWLSRHESAF